MYATKSSDRSDERDERGELETAIYGHILPPCPLLYFEKKVKIKLEELIEKKTVYNCLDSPAGHS